MKRLFTHITLILLLWCTNAYASVDQARQFVSALSEHTLSIIKNSQLPADEKEKQLTALFTQTIDTEWIGKFALGRYARTLTPEQQERYKKDYTQFLILNYVPNFREYTGQTLKVTSVNETGQNQYLVQTSIVSPDGSSIRVDYRLRQKDADFKVYDIIAEGVSLITTQRAEFGSILEEQGVDGLIQKLEERIKQGSGAPIGGK